MKKLLTVLGILFPLAAGAFLALWLHAEHYKTDIVDLASASAQEAHERFSDYQSGGNEGDYWGGVAAFHAYRQSFTLLAGGDESGMRQQCGRLYGSMLFSPEKVQKSIGGCAEIMRLLSENLGSDKAYSLMAQLQNEFDHGE